MGPPPAPAPGCWAVAPLLSGGRAPRLHLLPSVISDEVRYVNPIAAGKWRAGPGPRDLGAGDAAQEAEAGGGAEPGRRVGGFGVPGRGRGGSGAEGTAGRAGAARPGALVPGPPGGSAAARVSRSAPGFLRVSGRALPSGQPAPLLSQPSLTAFELGTRWTSLSEKALLL